MATSKTSEIPVLISGAGPVGTLAAIMLTRLGIPCRLIERERTVSSLSKALSLHARTLEIMDQTGFIDRFLAHGHPLSIFNVYFNGVHSVFQGLVNSISHYNYALFMEQIKTTAVLTDELENYGIKVDRGWELLDTKVVVEQQGGSGQEKTWVETRIRRAKDGNNIRRTESKVLGVVELDAEEKDKEYEIEVVRSEYLIAADGGKSVVRHKVQIPFVGRTLENNVILFDGNIDTDLDLGDITVINGPNNATMNIFPLSDGQVRVMVDGSDLDPTKELTNEAFEKVAQAAAAPYRFKVLNSSWLTFYKVNERQASTYSYKNRIFLAGDAAHVHSPAGGQGMNLGLQDAYNLTWKLALVLNNLASPKLLETYEAERIPVARDVIKMSANMFAMGFSRQFSYRVTRKIITTFASYLLQLIRVPAATVSMLTIRYGENAINQTHKNQTKPDEPFQVGQRAHDGPLREILTGGETDPEKVVRLHQLIHGPGTFHILVFTSDMLSCTVSATTSGRVDHQGVTLTDEALLAQNIDRHLKQWQSRWVYGKRKFEGLTVQQEQKENKRPMFNVNVIGALAEQLASSDFEDPSKIQADILVNKAQGLGKIYFDETSIVHERYGVPIKAGSGSIVVVRPDSHIGYRVQGAGDSAWEDVDQYFKSILIA